MKINKNHKLHDLAGEKIIFLQGSAGKEMSKVMSLNETAVFLWKELYDKEFSLQDIVSLLVENYDVNSEKAGEDASEWIEKLKKFGILE